VSALVRTLHVLGSRQFGGADQFFVRLVRRLADAGHPTLAVTRRSGPVAEALSQAGCQQVHLPLANQWDVLTVVRLRALVRRWKPDVVQSYMGRATRLTRLPRHTKAVHVARLGGYYKIRGYYAHAHAWVGNTRGVCEYLVAGGVPADRVFQIGNFVPDPVPCDAAAIRAERVKLRLPVDAWVLLALGRFIDIKGFDDFINAVSTIPAEISGRPVFALIAGDGPLRDTLHGMASRLALDGRIRWLGWCEQPSLYYRVCDVMVCPSRHETLGNVILEAWRHERPVVSTMTPGGMELVEDGVDGMLVPCSQPEALGRRIREMLDLDPWGRARIAAAGAAKVERDHGGAAVLDAYLTLYRSLIERRRTSVR